MATADFTLYVASPTGVQLDTILSYHSLDYIRAVNEVGTLKLVLPGSYGGRQYLQADSCLQVFRTPPGGQPKLDLEAPWLIQDVTEILDNGVPSIEVTAVSANHLLTRRIVPYYDGGVLNVIPGAAKSGAADDLMKQYVRDNFGAVAGGADGTYDANRDWSAFLTVQANATQGPALTVNAAKKVVFDLLKEMVQAAVATDVTKRCYFDVVQPGPTNDVLEFRTYLNQRGVDHSLATGGASVSFSPDFANIILAQNQRSYLNEITAVYAFGPGSSTDQTIVLCRDATREARTRWGRRESQANAASAYSPSTVGGTTSQDAPDAAAITTQGNLALANGRPRLRFWADLRDTVATTRGMFWDWGDVVTTSLNGQNQDCRVEAIHVSVQGGLETNQVRLTNEVFLS